ncbi:hypothetical protein B0H13DRAFT_2300150 [Mycena leptocephala]|nr:hypothetical protein B0H13DRAFT_2300150 [Mycena leptocephala]
MDEASSDALRTLCCQLADLEREKEGWKCTEKTLRKTRERHREAEIGWEREKQELLAAAELQNAGLVAELEEFKHQLKDRREEPRMLKSELYSAGTDDGERAPEQLYESRSARIALSHSTKSTLSTPTPVHHHVASAAVNASSALKAEKENVDVLVPV